MSRYISPRPPRSNSKKEKMETAHAGIYFYSIIVGFCFIAGPLLIIQEKNWFMGILAILIGLVVLPMVFDCKTDYKDLKKELEQKDNSSK